MSWDGCALVAWQLATQSITPGPEGRFRAKRVARRRTMPRDVRDRGSDPDRTPGRCGLGDAHRLPNVPAWEDGVLEVRQTSPGSVSPRDDARRASRLRALEDECRLPDHRLAGGPLGDDGDPRRSNGAGDRLLRGGRRGRGLPRHVLRQRPAAPAPGLALADHPVSGPTACSLEPRSTEEWLDTATTS